MFLFANHFPSIAQQTELGDRLEKDLDIQNFVWKFNQVTRQLYIQIFAESVVSIVLKHNWIRVVFISVLVIEE